jgi:hypothetical protein
MTTRPAEEIANSSPSATVATFQEVVTMHEFAEPPATPSAISVVESLSPIPNCVKLMLKVTTHHVASVRRNLMLNRIWTSCNARNVVHGIVSHVALPTLLNATTDLSAVDLNTSAD